MLRNPDNLRVIARHSLLILALGMSMAAAVDSSKQLAAAMHREMVLGDLKGAIEQYKTVVDDPGAARQAAASALLHMGQCLERLGQRKEARVVYTRLANDYRDQGVPATEARLKLDGWTDAAPGPRNLSFEEGEPGKTPPGWFAPSVGQGVAELRRKGCLHVGCAVVTGATARNRLGNLMQSFSAAAYRGKTVRVKARLRLDPATPAERAQLWMRVDRAGGQDGYSDNMDDRPVRSTNWTHAQTISEVDSDAQFLSFGVSSVGLGSAWVDEVSFEIVPSTEVESARQAVRELYRAVDSAYRNASAIPTVLDGAVNITGDRREPIASALGRRAAFRSQMLAYRLTGGGAVATVRCDFSRGSSKDGESGVAQFRDTWSRSAEGWRLSERRYIGGHVNAALTNTEATKLVAADLKRLASPLATAEAGHTFYDIAPFGVAVREASIVVLGAAIEGTRETQQMRNRILEYLVRERGFSVLAVPIAATTAAALDDYIKAGTGDPRRILASAQGFDSREMLEAVEWMRNRNRTPGAAAISIESIEPCRPAMLDVTDTRTGCQGHDRGSELEAITLRHPTEKIILWTSNFDLAQPGFQSLRDRLGKKIYVTALAVHAGQARIPVLRSGVMSAAEIQMIAQYPDGTGDNVLSAAGMALFFLDLRAAPAMTTLGLWLAEPHLFLNVPGSWNHDDPENHLVPAVPASRWDGLIFIEQGRPAQPLDRN